MPNIYDNLNESTKLVSALRQALSCETAFRADFCVGYFNLRGWNAISDCIDKFEGGKDKNCRLLIGMEKTPAEYNLQLYSKKAETLLDHEQAKKMIDKMLFSFREQLLHGIPDNQQEASLKKLLEQLRNGKVVVKFYLQNLHAKLYLVHRKDGMAPIIPYLGSSNLTYSGLKHQGELNVDVIEQDAATKLEGWFQARWNERWCIDITKQLIEVLENSWAGNDVSPYYVYLKMAYHMSQEARDGLSDFTIPKEFKNELLDFQQKAVLTAAKYLNTRNGILIGDVVGLGKTITASCIAKIFENDLDSTCLIICPANLQGMWQKKYVDKYDLRARIISSAKVQTDLPNLRRYKLIIIDESHNFRNRSSKRYLAIKDYIQKNDSKVILLSATPYNKNYLDISSQLRLFIDDDEQLPVRPERFLSDKKNNEVINELQNSLRSIQAFEKSTYQEDWQDLLRYYMIRRTRGFIKENYAEIDEKGRKFLTMPDGTRSYFPERIAKSVKFKVDDKNENDQYAKLYQEKIVKKINSLNIPRYGLANELLPEDELKKLNLGQTEKEIIKNLSKAGESILGFCRTNLYKRLESSGYSFILSIRRHILRNKIYLYALENKLEIPVGSQDFDFRDEDTRIEKDTEDDEEFLLFDDKKNTLDQIAESMYNMYQNKYKNRFNWVRSEIFKDELKEKLNQDNKTLESILRKVGVWKPENDEKLKCLCKFIKEKSNEKILIFTQYADTANYLSRQLKVNGIDKVGVATGETENPTELANRFSPISNDVSIQKQDELRILIATDVLSEGQNIQDAFIVVNFDLPWAIIKLIQRAGRVDRLGQKSDKIYCYNFLPADGVEKIIFLRDKLKTRLIENANVVGTDEKFFDDEIENKDVRDLYNENAKCLEDDEDNDIDLSSFAYQIWQNAIKEEPKLKDIISSLQNVVYSTKKSSEKGVIVYTKTSIGNDNLSFIDDNGNIVPYYSQFKLLTMASCSKKDGVQPRLKNHHELVAKAVEYADKKEKAIGGQLGKKTGARYRVYQRLTSYLENSKNTIFATDATLKSIIDDIYKHPLTLKAKDTLNRQLKAEISDIELLKIVENLKNDGCLCNMDEEVEEKDPQIICSLGLCGA